jgi:uncharacterized protein (DUF433 family)
MNYKDIITIEPNKRGGKPCIRGMRITVYDVLEYLAAGISEAEILEDFPRLTHKDIAAVWRLRLTERKVCWSFNRCAF